MLMDYRASASFGRVPKPISEGKPFSVLPRDQTQIHFRARPIIPSEILANMRMTDFVGYAANTEGLKLNQVMGPANVLCAALVLLSFGF